MNSNIGNFSKSLLCLNKRLLRKYEKGLYSVILKDAPPPEKISLRNENANA